MKSYGARWQSGETGRAPVVFVDDAALQNDMKNQYDEKLQRRVDVLSLVARLTGYPSGENSHYPQILWITLWNTWGKPKKMCAIPCVALNWQYSDQQKKTAVFQLIEFLPSATASAGALIG